MAKLKLPEFVQRVIVASTPSGLGAQQRKNLLYTQMDALGVGIVSGVAPFLAVFLTRLGATNFEVGLLSAMPGFTGLFLAIVMGRFLQNRRDIIPWYSGSRLLVNSAYVLTGVAALLLPHQAIVPMVLIIWGLASLPQTLLSVSFTVVMNGIAGPRGRFTFMSRRWATLGLTSALSTALAGQVLERLAFPVNYPVVFIGFSLGGLISFAFSRRLYLPSPVPDALSDAGEAVAVESAPAAKASWWAPFKQSLTLALQRRAFVTFSLKRTVYILGSTLSAPLFSLYYVREAQASDAWISIITMMQQALLLIGYYLWPRQRDKRGSRFVLLSTTLLLSLYPIATAFTPYVGLLVVYAGVTAIFQAGLNLVFFDELMKTVPPEHSATFVAVDQTLQNLLVMIGPLLSTGLSGYIGIGGALIVSGLMRLLGCGLFFLGKEGRSAES